MKMSREYYLCSSHCVTSGWYVKDGVDYLMCLSKLWKSGVLVELF